MLLWVYRFSSTFYIFNSEKHEMGKERMGLQRRVEELLSEKEKLQAANAELQRQRDNVEDEKEDLLKDLARKEKELERRYVFVSWLLQMQCIQLYIHSFVKFGQSIDHTQNPTFTINSKSNYFLLKVSTNIILVKCKSDNVLTNDFDIIGRDRNIS